MEASYSAGEASVYGLGVGASGYSESAVVFSPGARVRSGRSPEGEKEHQRLIAKFVEFCRSKVGEGSQ